MKNLIFAVSIIYLSVPSPLSAQSGLFGTCTQDRVIKFIDVGLTKSEIVQLCALPAKKQSTASNQPKKNHTARPEKTKRQFGRLKWRLDDGYSV
jgi:hypothetical protein